MIRCFLCGMLLLVGIEYAHCQENVNANAQLPLKKIKLTSGFGIRRHPLTGLSAKHEGIDIQAEHDSVRAIMDGKVIKAAYHKNLGIFLMISHSARLISTYGHLSKINVSPGDSVQAGDCIAITGNTGNVTGEHLHFEIWWDTTALNPLKFLFRFFGLIR